MNWIRGIVAAGAGMAAAALASSAAEVRIVGTDLLGKEFSTTIYSGARRAGTSVLVALDGSRPGLGRLKSNWADMGLLTLPADETAQLGAFHVETLAYHCVWVVVAEECPLREISLAQLAAIFGVHAGKPRRAWSDLGVTANVWRDQAVEVLAPETGAGVGLEFFRSVVLGGGALADDVIRYREAREMQARLEKNPHAIVLSAHKPETETGKLRALAISPRAGAAAVIASAESLHRGEYPLRLPLQLVLPQERKETLWAWIAWWRSDEAARALERAGLVAAPRGK